MFPRENSMKIFLGKERAEPGTSEGLEASNFPKVSLEKSQIYEKCRK